MIFFSNIKSNFEELAVGILGICNEKNEEKAHLLLIRELSIYGNATALQLAIACDAKKFVAHPCTQNMLTSLWYGKILPDTSKPKVRMQKRRLHKVLESIWINRSN